MIYLASPSTDEVRAAMTAGALGAMLSPTDRHLLPPHCVWAADNGIYAGKYPGTERLLTWLRRYLDSSPDAGARCLFAAAPDVLHRVPDGSVVGDAAATLERGAAVLPRIRALGVPAALVGQDGLEHLSVPWDTFDVLFLGGSTAWKLGRAAWELSRQARARGKRVHMGRLSSFRRWSYAEHIGCSSADGTFIGFGPRIRLPEALGWRAQLSLFTDEH